MANPKQRIMKKRPSENLMITIPAEWVGVMQDMAEEAMRRSVPEWVREDVLRPLVLEALRDRNRT